MRLLVASTVAAFGALTAADGLQLKRSFLSLSSNEALALLDPPTLQEQLDRRCRNEAEKICKNGNERYCTLSDIFARYDTGTAAQTTKQWRCFLMEELDFEAYGQSCVDNCGNMVMCLGVNKTPSKEHLTRPQALTEVIQTHKPTYCKAPAPSLQESLNRKCYERANAACAAGQSEYCSAPMYARHDVTAGSNERQWRCYASSSLSFTHYGTACADACGNLTTCQGSAVGEINPPPLDHHTVLSETIDNNAEAYCDSRPLTLQGVLDRECDKLGRNRCVSGINPEFCGIGLVARKDIGRSNQREMEWRCYAETALTYDQYSPRCVDNCGNLIDCVGRVNGATTLHVTRGAQLTALIEANKDSYCSKTKHLYTPLQDPMPEEPTHAGEPSEDITSAAPEVESPGSHAGAATAPTPEAQQPTVPEQPSQDIPDVAPEVESPGSHAGAATAPTPEAQQPTVPEQPSQGLPEIAPEVESPGSHAGAATSPTPEVQQPTVPEQPSQDIPDVAPEVESPGSHAGAATSPTPEEQQPTMPEQPSAGIPEVAPEVESPGSHAGAATAPTPEVQQPTVPEQPPETTREDEQAPALLVGPGPPRVPGTGILQEILDTVCIEKFAKNCLTDASFCQYAVARKDANGWHCVAFKGLDYRHSTHGCVDKCGNIISCPGKGSGATKYLTATDLEQAKNQYERMTCKVPEHQRATASR